MKRRDTFFKHNVPGFLRSIAGERGNDDCVASEEDACVVACVDDNAAESDPLLDCCDTVTPVQRNQYHTDGGV